MLTACLHQGRADRNRDFGRCAAADSQTDRAVQPERYWPQLALYGLAARACGWADGEIELALFYVRHGRIERRPLDEALVAQVGPLVQSALAEDPDLASDGASSP